MKKIILYTVIAALLWQPAKAQNSETAAKYFSKRKGTITIAAPPAMSAVMRRIMFKICSTNNNLTGNVTELSQSKALLALQQEKVDIAIISREPEFVIKQCNSWQVFPFAATAIVIVVNPQQKLDNISRQNLIDIFSGKLERWQKLTGEGEMLHLIGLYPETVGGELFQQFIMRKRETTQKLFTVSSGAQVDIIVTNDRYAMGFRFYSPADSRSPVKMLAIDHISPDTKTICDGKYPLTVTFYICFNSKSKNPLTPKFISYFKSAAFTAQLKEAGLLIPSPRKAAPVKRTKKRHRKRHKAHRSITELPMLQ